MNFSKKTLERVYNTRPPMTDYSYLKHVHTLLNKHAPIKKEIMRFNNNPFMSKALSKAFMHRSKLKNIYNNYRTEGNWANYKM